jgi:hypothetical protein
VFIGGGNTLLFIVKTYSCCELMSDADRKAVYPELAVAAVTVTQAPVVQTHQNCHNHVLNKTVVR